MNFLSIANPPCAGPAVRCPCTPVPTARAIKWPTMGRVNGPDIGVIHQVAYVYGCDRCEQRNSKKRGVSPRSQRILRYLPGATLIRDKGDKLCTASALRWARSAPE